MPARQVAARALLSGLAGISFTAFEGDLSDASWRHCANSTRIELIEMLAHPGGNLTGDLGRTGTDVGRSLE